VPGQAHPSLEATESQLVSAYNEQAARVRTLNASVRMSPTAGSAYSGLIHEYHELGGFILASRPAMIRVIGQAPVVSTNLFDMVSDGHTFRIFIPSKDKFLVGPTALERPSQNPIENLRPQHILDALFWTPIAGGEPVLFEESDASPSRYYVLTVLRSSCRGLEISYKVWFDRADLRASRMQIYGPGGRLDSDIRYADWQPIDSDAAANGSANSPEASLARTLFPREIRITRPQQDYQLTVAITKLALNAEITADRFTLEQPSGTELVNLAANEREPQP
jgi:outer membrane lipoprotein-sorting protein